MRGKGETMKLRHAVALASAVALFSCESRFLANWSFSDWVGLCVIVLAIGLALIGLVALAKMTPR